MINIKEFIVLFLKGVLMGASDIMPGISGGTIALITGIYDKLIGAISNVKLMFIKPLLKGNLSEFKRQLCDEIDFPFFIPLGLGVVAAMLLMASIITFLLGNYAAYTYSFFGGLILASIYVLYKQLDAFNIKAITTTIIFAILAYMFVGLNPMQASHSLIVLFISGFIAICAMLLPGISGSSLLLLLGQYEYMINALHQISIVEILVFVVGAVLGLMSMSRVIKYMLNNHKQLTVATLIGIMLGSLRIPLDNILLAQTASIPLCIIIAIVAMAIVIFVEVKYNFSLIEE